MCNESLSNCRNLDFYSNSIINSLQKELANKLGKMSGCDEYQLFLNSGAEANENAIKLSSFVNGRKKVLSFKKVFTAAPLRHAMSQTILRLNRKSIRL